MRPRVRAPPPRPPCLRQRGALFFFFFFGCLPLPLTKCRPSAQVAGQAAIHELEQSLHARYAAQLEAAHTRQIVEMQMPEFRAYLRSHPEEQVRARKHRAGQP